MSENKITSDMLRGHTDTMILRLLSEADRYGYEIVKLIAERSGGEYELKEATMYSSVRRLEATAISSGIGAMNLRADGVSIFGLRQRARPLTPTTKATGSTQSAYSINYCKEI